MPPAFPPAAVLENVEARELAHSFGAAPAGVASELRLGHEWRGETLVVWAAALDVPMFNRALGVGLARPAREADVRAIAERFEREAPPRAFVQVAPDARPAELSRWLEAEGFTPFNRWARLARRLDDLPEPSREVRVERIGAERAQVFAEIFAEGFRLSGAVVDWVAAEVGQPHWLHYLGYADGAPVGTAALAPLGECAWFGYAATRERARGRGVQSALIARRLTDAAALGCRFVTVETAEDKPEKPAPSFRNLRRLGFEPVYLRENWLKQRAG